MDLIILKVFVFFCIGISFLTIGDIVVNAIKDTLKGE